MPISLVRSVTVTSIIFIMPMPPTSRDMQATPARISDRLVVSSSEAFISSFPFSTVYSLVLLFRFSDSQLSMRLMASYMLSDTSTLMVKSVTIAVPSIERLSVYGTSMASSMLSSAVPSLA